MKENVRSDLAGGNSAPSTPLAASRVEDAKNVGKYCRGKHPVRRVARLQRHGKQGGFVFRFHG